MSIGVIFILCSMSGLAISLFGISRQLQEIIRLLGKKVPHE